MSFHFEWDPQKAVINKREHGVTFEQAITVWDDPGALEDYDVAHSHVEDRFTRIGLSDIGILVVVFTERRGYVLLLITARRADREEEKIYYEYQAH